MTRFLAQRLLQLLPLLLLTTVVSFAVMQLSPGGPLSAYEHSPSITAAQLKIIAHDLGLDQPAPVQYWRWLSGLVHGQWGYSLQSGEPVATLILERLGNTLELVATAFAISLLIAVPLGVLSSVRQYSGFDYLATFFSFVAYSIPVFWAGLMAQLLFSVKLGWLPVAGLYTEGVPWTFVDAIKHLALPALVLGLGLIAGWSRYLRSSMLEVLQLDYLRTARAKGASSWSVVLKHALRNAVVPLVTVIALDIPLLFTGALVVEVVFSWPGEGRLFYDALQNRDYPVLMGVLLISAFLILFSNLVADMLYGFLNPRVRYD
ncbi:MAG TPA: ABC transporter permease [Chloroflexota bacterium]|nr:ABC transporter permease [Chloroflexota bacterium]